MIDDSFGRNKKSKDGFNVLCKKCQKEINHRNYTINREDRLRKANEYRANNLEQCREYDRMRYQRDKDHRNATSKIWCEKNKDYVVERARKWRNTERGKSIARKHSQFRQKHKIHKISKQEWIDNKAYFGNVCAYCGMPEDEHKKLYNQQLHKDHADPNGSNGISNCIPACKRCNSEKRDVIWNEWYTPNNKHYKERKYNAILKWLSEDYRKYTLNP